MKEKLYFGYVGNNDTIHRKINTFCENNNMDENMDDSASANERFEGDSVDGSELEELDSVDSGSIITTRGGMGSTKGKTKKQHGRKSGRKGSAKCGKGSKNKGFRNTPARKTGFLDKKSIFCQFF